MKPIIGCVASYDEDRIFLEKPTEAVHAFEGHLVFLSHSKEADIIKEYCQVIDGLLIGGGLEDVSPQWQDERKHPKLGYVDETRDYFEIHLLKEALKLNIPVLGICRGPHIINIAAGGTIYQDVVSQRGKETLDHLGDWELYQKGQCSPNMHSINIIEHSLLKRLIPENDFIVNSYHHQAVRKVASNFKVSAFSEDGVIEAIESDIHNFVLGIQWHAELLWKKSGHKEIFKEFLNWANKRHIRRDV